MRTDDLIDRLGRDVSVARPLPTPGKRTALWMVWAVSYLIVVAVAVSAHPRRCRVPDEVHALRELLPVDGAILRGEVIEAAAGRLVRSRIELEQLL